MVALGVILIIAGCAAYQYFKGTFAKAFATIIITICANAVAFGYFEVLADVFISRGENSKNAGLIPWAQSLSFVLLFVLALLIFQTILSQLMKSPVSLGLWAERIGRVACGIFLGLILSGTLITALAMAPLPTKWPYQRFAPSNPNAEKPTKAFLDADSLVTGWFGAVSNGGFAGKNSFAVAHADFLDQAFLNRHNLSEEVLLVTTSKAIEVPSKKATWPAPQDLKDSSGRLMSAKTGHNLMIVRVGLKKTAIRTAGAFTLSQLRLVCNKKSNKDPLAGKGKSVYPIGYLKTANQVQEKRLDDQMKIEAADFAGKVKWIDFVFSVPNDSRGVLVEFKQNSIAEIPTPVAVEQAPSAQAFIQLSNCARDFAELDAVASAKIYGLELAAGGKLLADLTLKITDPNQWRDAQTNQSIKPIQYADGKITFVRAQLQIAKSEESAAQTPAATRPRRGRFTRRRTFAPAPESFIKKLEPLAGYKLLSLKCNKPSGAVAIKAGQLPVLIELSGLIHHPVGVIVSASAGEQIIYEVDYCSVSAEDTEGGLVIAQDGTVAQPFPDSVWLTKQSQSISEFYVLYLVKSGRGAIITMVRPGDSQNAAGFKKAEGFFIK